MTSFMNETNKYLMWHNTAQQIKFHKTTYRKQEKTMSKDYESIKA